MNNKDIFVTFGIPMYNAEKYIDELLKCFDFNITNISYEVIVIDDGSTDESAFICSKYKDKIKLIKQKNSGVSAARNKVIEIARGKWLTFIDADDLINMGEYIKELSKLKNKKYDFVINIHNSKRYENCIKQKNILSHLISNEIINSPVTKFYKTEIIKNNKIIFNSKYSIGEDLLFNITYYSKCKNISFICNDKMYIIRTDNQNSLSRKYRKNKFEELMNVNSECLKICEGCNRNTLKSLEYIRIKACLSCVKDIIVFPNKITNPNKMIKYMKKYKKKKYIFMDNISNTIVYNMWYILPPKCIISIVKIIIRK